MEISLEAVVGVMRDMGGWGDINELRGEVRRRGLVPEGFDEAAGDLQLNQHLRRLLQTRLPDETRPVFASVINEDGKRVYKQESLFDLSDYDQVIDYHKKRAAHHSFMARDYEKAKEEKMRQLALPLPEEVEA